MARYQPPPMQPATPAGNRVTLDEKVVRKMLRVNPSLRKGRTTLQVKKALEQGEPIAATNRTPETTPAPVPASKLPALKTPAPAPAADLAASLGLVLPQLSRELKEGLEGLAVRRSQLDAEEGALKSDLGSRVLRFIAMLDPLAVAAHGQAALTSHVELLASLGLTPATVLTRVAEERNRRRP